MPDDEELIFLSALQHFLFCPRQCALIHIEGAWADNALTAEGQVLHHRVNESKTVWEGGMRVEFGLRLQSAVWGLTGMADRVEFNPQPIPVETKHGKPKKGDEDRVQLCAQALCLEEMLGVPVPQGAIFYAKTRHRESVPFTPELRRKTQQAIADLRALLAQGQTPPPPPKAKCRNCSLLDQCLPQACSGKRSAARYLREESQQ